MHSKNHGNYRSHITIGDMSYLIRNYQSTTYDDFFNKYINDREDGRSIECVKKIAESMSYVIKEDYNTCLNAIVYSIVSIVDGYKMEQQIKQRLQTAHPEWIITEPTATQDRMGIDLIVEDKCNIQVKPLSFFMGDYNQGLVRDRQCLLKYIKQMDKPLLIAMYDGDYIIPHLYAVNQLMDANGHSISSNITKIKQGLYDNLL